MDKLPNNKTEPKSLAIVAAGEGTKEEGEYETYKKKRSGKGAGAKKD